MNDVDFQRAIAQIHEHMIPDNQAIVEAILLLVAVLRAEARRAIGLIPLDP